MVLKSQSLVFNDGVQERLGVALRSPSLVFNDGVHLQESLESLVLPQGMASEQYQLLRKVAQEMQSSRIGELNWAQ